MGPRWCALQEAWVLGPEVGPRHCTAVGIFPTKALARPYQGPVEGPRQCGGCPANGGLILDVIWRCEFLDVLVWCLRY